MLKRHGGIHTHMPGTDPGDWTAEDLFEQLGAFDAGDGRFGRFLQGLVSADLIPTSRRSGPPPTSSTRACAKPERSCARQAATVASGISVVLVGAARHRQLKNLVFASQVKPDIRISDAISNDIEILENADRVLVYDRPVRQ